MHLSYGDLRCVYVHTWMRYSYALVLCCHVALYLSATSYPSRTVQIHSLCRYGYLRCIYLHMDVFMLRCCPVFFSAYTELLRILVGATATDAVM